MRSCRRTVNLYQTLGTFLGVMIMSTVATGSSSVVSKWLRARAQVRTKPGRANHAQLTPTPGVEHSLTEAPVGIVAHARLRPMVAYGPPIVGPWFASHGPSRKQKTVL